MLKPRWARIASDITKLYAELDCDVAGFVRDSDLHCPPGCGACCLSPHVETTVAEMLPLALLLFDEGQVDEVLLRLQQRSAICVQYEALPGQPEKGRCRRYAQRPVLCRLFGYVGTRDKTGQPRFGACRVLQKVEAERISLIEARLQAGQIDIPFLAPAHERVAEIGGILGTEMLPINEALLRAIEVIGLSQQLEDGVQNPHPKILVSP